MSAVDASTHEYNVTVILALTLLEGLSRDRQRQLKIDRDQLATLNTILTPSSLTLFFFGNDFIGVRDY